MGYLTHNIQFGVFLSRSPRSKRAVTMDQNGRDSKSDVLTPDKRSPQHGPLCSSPTTCMGVRTESPHTQNAVLATASDVMRIEHLLNPLPPSPIPSKEAPPCFSRSLSAGSHAGSGRFRLRSMTSADWMNSRRLPPPWSSSTKHRLLPRLTLQDHVLSRRAYGPRQDISAHTCPFPRCDVFLNSISELRQHELQAHAWAFFPKRRTRTKTIRPPIRLSEYEYETEKDMEFIAYKPYKDDQKEDGDGGEKEHPITVQSQPKEAKNSAAPQRKPRKRKNVSDDPNELVWTPWVAPIEREPGERKFIMCYAQ